MNSTIEPLLNSDEPGLRYKAQVNLLGMDPNSTAVQETRRAVQECERAQKMLSVLQIDSTLHAYQKWNGAHWVLSLLAELGFPGDDSRLGALFEQEFSWLLSKQHESRILTINGRVRRCASQEGNGLYAALVLKPDPRAGELAERLMKWQWPDGGWNCDKNPDAHHSSFMETLIPLRGMARYAKDSGDPRAAQSAERAAEIFLKRNLYRRQSDGEVIFHEFIKLHYPCYWHYDILFGLKVMAEAGFIGDPRCGAALDLLESMRLPDGGFPATARYYQVAPEIRKATGFSRVDWGGTSLHKMNPWVTADALYVLQAAGRI